MNIAWGNFCHLLSPSFFFFNFLKLYLQNSSRMLLTNPKIPKYYSIYNFKIYIIDPSNAERGAFIKLKLTKICINTLGKWL